MQHHCTSMAQDSEKISKTQAEQGQGGQGGLMHDPSMHARICIDEAIAVEVHVQKVGHEKT
jgi:hypothetical protein